MKPHAAPTHAPLLALLLLAAAAAPAAAQPGRHDHAAHLRAATAGAGEVEDAGGLAIPDVEVTTQDGDTVRFYRDLVRDRVVAINFVFTTCTTVCPPMGAIFGQLEKRLGDRAGRDVHLISVSVDPATDTPERLAEWASRFGRRPGWTLVTGDKRTIDSLLKALAVFTPDFADHAPVALLGNDAAGTWTRAHGLASPARLAAILERLAGAESAVAEAAAGGG
jgi:protein SCO1/2